jgi:NADH-quinone oxidoreductase subunit M
VTLAQLGPTFDPRFQQILFLAFFFGFAIKVPIVPFHTWLPDAHVDAPTPISVILAGVLLKMGSYGFLRISYPLFPDGAQGFAWTMAALGMINIVYGAFVAMAQTDFKRLVAYSSVSHMGFVLLGLSSFSIEGMNGALLQMFNHGIITGALFLLVGVLYDRAHTRDLTAFGGLGATLPVYAGFLTVFSLASLGLPGLSGFVGEFLSLVGTYGVWRWQTMVSVLGIVITAAYMLTVLQRVLMGPLNQKWARLPDMRPREVWTLVPLLLLVLLVGLYPLSVLRWQQPALEALLAHVAGRP